MVSIWLEESVAMSLSGRALGVTQSDQLVHELTEACVSLVQVLTRHAK